MHLNPKYSNTSNTSSNKRPRLNPVAGALLTVVLAAVAALTPDGDLGPLALVNRYAAARVRGEREDRRSRGMALVRRHYGSVARVEPLVGSVAPLRQLVVDPTPGPIPRDLGRCLRSLRTLDLSDATGAIPAELGLLTELRYLRLARCRQATCLPDTMSALVELRSLNLYGCIRLRAIPTGLTALQRLEDLNLSGANVGPSVTQTIAALTALHRLCLDDCRRVRGPVTIDRLSSLQALRHMSLYYTSIETFPFWVTLRKARGTFSTINVPSRLSVEATHDLWDVLSALGHGARDLTSLSLDGCCLRGNIPKRLGRLTRLVTLDLTRCRAITGPLPTELGALRSLHVMRLQACGVTGGIPGSFSALESLRELNLRWCQQLRGTVPLSLSALANLKKLDLRFTNLSGSSLGGLYDTCAALRPAMPECRFYI